MQNAEMVVAREAKSNKKKSNYATNSRISISGKRSVDGTPATNRMVSRQRSTEANEEKESGAAKGQEGNERSKRPTKSVTGAAEK